MTLINLTPHAINLPGLTVPPSGTVARCRELTESAGTLNGVEFVTRRYGAVEGLPEPEEGVVYIVSALVRLALPERCDLASPGDLIRDETGQIVGARNLVINAPYQREVA